MKPLDLGPFIIVKYPRPIKEKVTTILKLLSRPIRARLSQLYEPFGVLLLPMSPDNLGVEVHVLSQPKDFYHFLEIFLDVRCIREESRPVRLFAYISTHVSRNVIFNILDWASGIHSKPKETYMHDSGHHNHSPDIDFPTRSLQDLRFFRKLHVPHFR